MRNNSVTLRQTKRVSKTMRRLTGHLPQILFPELLLELLEERKNLSEQVKRHEFDNWTLRSALTQLRQESDDALKELASIKVTIFNLAEIHHVHHATE
jgi:hypothetical protein